MRIKLSLFIFCCFLISTFCVCSANSLQDNYNDALELLTQGKYTEAANAFDSLFGYEDSNLYATYSKGLAARENGDYDLSMQAFEMLGEFRDSAYQKQYYLAREYESQGNFGSLNEAISIYEGIKLFRDSNDRIDHIQEEMHNEYDRALQMGLEGDFAGAADAFYVMSGYQDSSVYASYYSARLQIAENSWNMTSLLEAYEEFNNIRYFLDSEEQATVAGQLLWDSISIGSDIYFGDNSNISWTVLSKDDNQKSILLLCNETYNIKGFQDYHFRSWDASNMRDWLNSDFLSSYFYNSRERNIICYHSVTNAHSERIDSGIYLWTDEEDTIDEVFLLSVDEVETYLPSPSNRCLNNTKWVLRNKLVLNRMGPIYYYEIDENGEIGYLDISNKYAYMNLRPALWISLG